MSSFFKIVACLIFSFFSLGLYATPFNKIDGAIFPCSIKFSPGWKNRHTLNFYVVASPHMQSIGIKRRKKQSESRAWSCSKSKIYDLFKRKNPKFVSGPAFSRLRNQFIALLNQMRAKKIEFDKNQNCKITLSIGYTNLQALIGVQKPSLNQQKSAKK